MEILGIDIGGTGVKAAPVNVETGELTQERLRIETPQPATIENIGSVIKQMTDHFQWSGKIGCGFPGVVQNGVVLTAANLDKSCMNKDAANIFGSLTGCETVVVNDADAAGLAEVRFGGGKGKKGITLMLTIGTGIGSAIIVDEKLVPNTEFGHIYMANGMKGEHYCSERVRIVENLKWKEWARRLNEYLMYMEGLIYPDLIIIGGGVSKDHKKYFKHLTLKAPIEPAKLFNEAGIIGAALAAL